MSNYDSKQALRDLYYSFSEDGKRKLIKALRDQLVIEQKRRVERSMCEPLTREREAVA